MVTWAVIKVAWLDGENYWTEEIVCWKIVIDKGLPTFNCDTGYKTCELETPLKSAVGLFEVQLGYVETGYILSYNQ